MRYWKGVSGAEFLAANPYCGPYKTAAEAEAWAAKIRLVHRDTFRVIAGPHGYDVEQDVPDDKK